MKKLKNISLVFVVMFCYNALGSSIEKVTISTQVADSIEEEMNDINSLKWVFEFEDNKKERFLVFFKNIIEVATNNEMVQIINKLSGNIYNIHFSQNPNILHILDVMPDNRIKRQAFSTLGQIADWAKQGNSLRIISLLNNIVPNNFNEYDDLTYEQLETVFPIERKDIFITFIRRMDNHAGRGNLHNIFSISKSVENNNLIEAYDIFENMTSLKYLNYGDKKLYDLRASIMNLEDFGAGYRSFEIWKKETYNLLSTLNLRHKPRILELLSYVGEANLDSSNFTEDILYFRPKVQRVVGEIFPAIRTDIPDGCLRCDGSEHQVSEYQYFVDKYLKTRKIPPITISAWGRQYDSQDKNCGSFGYDENGKIFITPSIRIGTFITAGTIGKFDWDRIVDITGTTDYVLAIKKPHIQRE